MSEPSERERHWRKIVQAQEQSGLSVPAWCDGGDLNPHTLYWWRRELRRRDERRAAEGPGFLPVRVVPDEDRPSGELRVALRGRREVIVTADFDEQLLARLVRVLEELPC